MVENESTKKSTRAPRTHCIVCMVYKSVCGSLSTAAATLRRSHSESSPRFAATLHTFMKWWSQVISSISLCCCYLANATNWPLSLEPLQNEATQCAKRCMCDNVRVQRAAPDQQQQQWSNNEKPAKIIWKSYLYTYNTKYAHENYKIKILWCASNTRIIGYLYHLYQININQIASTAQKRHRAREWERVGDKKEGA